jgi:hypothetical protein
MIPYSVWILHCLARRSASPRCAAVLAPTITIQSPCISAIVHHSKMAEPPTKRRRLGRDSDGDALGAEDNERATSSSLSHPISPPRIKRAKVRTRISSPFRLTSIQDLSDHCNIGAVSLKDLIGDPLIAELWDFNYLHDIDFLMNHLDEDTRALTRVHVVHGFWKREDPNKLMLQVSDIPTLSYYLCISTVHI